MAAPPAPPAWTAPVELTNDVATLETLIAQYNAKIADVKTKIGAGNKADAEKAATEAKDLLQRIIDSQRSMHSRLGGAGVLLSACANAASAVACSLGFTRGSRRRTGCTYGSGTMTNPETGYPIKYGGPTHNRLCAQGGATGIPCPP